MSPKMNDFHLENEIFDEEVSENDISLSNNYVVNKDKKSKQKWLFVLCLLLILTSLASFAYAFSRFSDGANRENEVNVIQYNLFVERFGSSYGGEIASFKEYDSLDKAFTYDFNVSNSNPVSLKYNLELVNSNFGLDNVDLSLINYSLVKNNVEVLSGTLSNVFNMNLYETDISSNAKDEYTLKLWSNEIDDNMKYSFRLNINV